MSSKTNFGIFEMTVITGCQNYWGGQEIMFSFKLQLLKHLAEYLAYFMVIRRIYIASAMNIN